jgi:hypothetical protein
VHESWTSSLKPFIGVTVTTAMPGVFCETVTAIGATDNVKPDVSVITSETAEEVEVKKFASPPYIAVSECVPADNDEV